jgi:hypothetical protein
MQVMVIIVAYTNDIVLEEHRMLEDMVPCSMDIATLQAQIITLNVELASL